MLLVDEIYYKLKKEKKDRGDELLVKSWIS